MTRIETKNLILISGNIQNLTSALNGNDALSKSMGYDVCPGWTEFGTEPLAYALKMISQDDNETGWWTYFPIHKADRVLIGSCGYKGKPTDDGIVELGYEVCLAYRQKGLGSEIANALLTNAFQYETVKVVVAHTLPIENASTKILIKSGFSKVCEIVDPEDGLVWRWECLKKEKISSSPQLTF